MWCGCTGRLVRRGDRGRIRVCRWANVGSGGCPLLRRIRAFRVKERYLPSADCPWCPAGTCLRGSSQDAAWVRRSPGAGTRDVCRLLVGELRSRANAGSVGRGWWWVSQQLPGIVDRVELTEVLVVVPARNEERLLPRCLQALQDAADRLAAERPGVAVRVVVVLDRCSDG